jgi:hypothetical protein
MAKRADITPELCRQLLRYEPETGKFYWNERDRSFFASQRSFASWNTKYAGNEALLQFSSDGYLRGVVMWQTLRAQRVAWAISYGVWPTGDVDHINGVKTDNRICNLRDVPRQVNSQNRRRRQNNSSGFNGVRLMPHNGRWRATIQADGQNVHLGVFETKEDAAAARKSAEARFGYHLNHGSIAIS